MPILGPSHIHGGLLDQIFSNLTPSSNVIEDVVFSDHRDIIVNFNFEKNSDDLDPQG
jgi:hypothetical protein